MKKDQNSPWRIVGPSIRVVIVMLVLAGIAYPLSLLAIGQGLFPFQTNGSIVNLSGKPVGSALIAENFTSPKFFHVRPASESASGVDPHITPDDAYSQVDRISNSTGIAANPLKTLIRLNIETNRAQNLGAFAPDYVNVLMINLDLMDQYPGTYKEFLNQTNSSFKGR